MVRFFIHRPVLSIVLSLVILIAGGVSILALPIAQYPQITPPAIVVQTQYTGANSSVVADTVAAPIEQQVNGAESMLYMLSRCDNSGNMTLTVTFDIARDQDMAQVDVQNRVSQAMPLLPSTVNQAGVTVNKQQPNALMYISIYSPDNTFDSLFISNYVSINMLDSLARIPGVGQANIIAGRRDYAMRVWVQPDKLAKLGVTGPDIARAIQDQNVQAAAGKIGAPPAPQGQVFTWPVSVLGRLDTVRQFEDIIVRTNPDGSILRIRDVARVELGAQDYSSVGSRNGQPAVPIAVYQVTGANAVQLSQQVRDKLEEMSKNFPSGLAYEVSYDNTDFVHASIDEVVHTLGEAIVLVLIVVFIFLGNVRATLIPMLAVPVSLIGTFAAFIALGFSINLLTLFGLVLAVGIVVDDAIVVVEAVEHHIEQGLSPLEATEKAMDEVSGPVIAIALVLCSVFVPVAFMGGISGRMYQQFAITLSVSVVLSALVALTLTPALCRLLLRPRKPMRGPVGWFLAGFNKVFEWVTAGYIHAVKATIRFVVIPLVAMGFIYYAAVHMQLTLPTGFLPDEDNGYVMINMMLPDGASLQRTQAAAAKVDAMIRKDENVARTLTFAGLNLITQTYSSNCAAIVAILKPWDERPGRENNALFLIRKWQRAVYQDPDAMVQVFNPPPIPGLGASSGFTMEIQDQAGHTSDELAAVTQQVIAAAREEPSLANLYTTFRPNIPQLRVDVDRSKVMTLGVPLGDVFSALQINLGGMYVNQFNKFGRTWRVYVQAEPQFRARPQDIGSFYVKNKDQEMVPMSTLTHVNNTTGPDVISRYNVYRATDINGANAPGMSSGQAMDAMEKVAKEVLPQGYGFEWTGTAYQQKLAGGAQSLILLLGLVFVFLFLAAQYESWAVPFAVLLGLPVGVMGAYGAASLVHLDNNLYVQIGLVMLIGLAAKNAILIVEFAKEKHDNEGMPLAEAAVEGARLRFRPILMTSFAFLLGVLPLVTATGAGAMSRRSLGTAVFGGMSAATTIGVFLIPVLYVLVMRIAGAERGRHKKKVEGDGAPSEPVEVVAAGRDGAETKAMPAIGDSSTKAVPRAESSEKEGS